MKTKPVYPQCGATSCRNKTKGNGPLCETCRKRAWRKLNIAKDSYSNLKQSAKRRNIPFDLSLEEFIQFGRETTYFLGKGRRRDALSVDRINDDPEKGYHGYRADNIQALQLGENSRKFQLQYQHENPRKFGFVPVGLQESFDDPENIF